MPGRFHPFYLSQGMRASAFLPAGFGDPAARARKVAEAAARRTAPALLDELARQNGALPPSRARDGNLASLGRGAAAVVTGQQVGLFLGPLYTVFKAATAVVVARRLSEETGRPCVPVFWLQTEDHDFHEIATCVVARDGDEPLRLSLAEHPGEERVSVAHRVLGPEVEDRLSELERGLESLPRHGEVLALLRAHYLPGAPVGRAFAGVLAALFADDGLLVYDPRQPSGARLAAGVIATALRDSERLDAVLAERGERLRAAGFEEQIPLRPGSPLAFFHPSRPSGPRHRLQRRGETLLVPRTEGGPIEVSEQELLARLEQEPLSFSTSALLRPIAQDTLFPTAVYVGGPAEVDYFAQLAPLYAAFGMEPPLVAPRARFRLLPARVRTLLQRLGLEGADFVGPRDGLLRKLSAARSCAAASAAGPELAWGAELEARLARYEADVAALDPRLVQRAARASRMIQRTLERLERRHRRVTVERDETLARRLARVEGWLRPGGAPQERVLSFPSFAAMVGLPEFVRAIIGAVDPFAPTPKDLPL